MHAPLSPDLLLQHEAFVLRLARSLVRDDATAEDVAQETWLRAVRTPPPAEGVRGWLTRVVRSRASDERTATRRRAAREELASRAEALEPEASASERLELQHGVVAAVLALAEPYRSVVVATYFEGLTPAELAARTGVPAATVRSQLTRALEQLRAKLDREHGERRAWSVALLGMLGESTEAATATVAKGVGAPTSTPWSSSPVAIGTMTGAAALVVAIAFVLSRREERTEPGVAASSAAANVSRELAPSVEPPERETRRVAAAAEAPASSAASSPPFEDATLADVPKVLERMRQAKQLYHTRWMEVSAEDRKRFAWLEASGEGGVTRLRDRTADADELELPWMRGGGAYFSFTDRVHDYNRRPQIGLQDGALLASFAGHSDSMILDLGAIDLRSVPSTARSLPPGIDPLGAIAWDAAWRSIGERERERHGLVEAMLRELVDDALADQRIDQAGWEELVHRRAVRSSPAREGHVYLVRSVSSGEHNVVVAIQTLHLDDEGCTLAWRLLESREVPNPRTPWKPSMLADELPPPPADLVAMSQTELRAEIDRLGTLSDRALFERFSPEIEARFGALRGRRDAGVVRLLGYLGPWSEASKARRGGGQYSLFERKHRARSYGLAFDPSAHGGTLRCAFAGYNCGAVVDLGAVEIEALDVPRAARLAGDLGKLVVEREFPLTGARWPAEPRERARASQEIARTERPLADAFQAEVRSLGSDSRAMAQAGHTYLMREVFFGEHDVLALVHVAAIDEYGVVLAYRILRERRFEPQRR